MTSPNDQIRALIAEIDATLEKPSNLLGRLSGEAAKNRDTLEHLRRYLLTLQNRMRSLRIRNQPAGGEWAVLAGAEAQSGLEGLRQSGESELLRGLSAGHGFQAGDVVDGEVEFELGEEPIDSAGGLGAIAQLGRPGLGEAGGLELEQNPLAGGEAIASPDSPANLSPDGSVALIQQLGHDLEQLRAGLMAPLQSDVNHLQQQHQLLAQEVQQLQHQHRNGLTDQPLQSQNLQSQNLQSQNLQALLQTLVTGLQAQVTHQVAEAIQSMQISGHTVAALPGEEVPSNGGELAHIQDHTQELLGNLDQTIRLFSQTLEQTVEGYHQSLAQGLGQVNPRDNRDEFMTELVNRLADEMEARGMDHPSSIQWDDGGQWVRETQLTEDDYEGGPGRNRLPAQPLSLSGESPMALGASRAGGQRLPRLARPLPPESLALEGPDLSLDSLDGSAFEAQPDDSTSSAGIARRRILAAQNSEQQAQQSLERESQQKSSREAASLDDFYASLGSAAQQRSMAAQQQSMAAQNRARASRPGGIKGHYRNLEDALFDGIPEGNNPWHSAAQAQLKAVPGSPQIHPQSRSVKGAQPPQQSQQYPPQQHRIQALTDLVDRRFDDFGQSQAAAADMPEAFAALYGDRQPAARTVKKKPFLRLIQSRRKSA